MGGMGGSDTGGGKDEDDTSVGGGGGSTGNVWTNEASELSVSRLATELSNESTSCGMLNREAVLASAGRLLVEAILMDGMLSNDEKEGQADSTDSGKLGRGGSSDKVSRRRRGVGVRTAVLASVLATQMSDTSTAAAPLVMCQAFRTHLPKLHAASGFFLPLEVPGLQDQRRSGCSACVFSPLQPPKCCETRSTAATKSRLPTRLTLRRKTS